MRLRWLALLFSIALFGQTPPAPKAAKPSEPYRIAGVVYDATTGQTLPAVRVSLGSTAGNHVPDRSVITGPDGSFAFDHLAADKYQMYAEAAGYPIQGFEQREEGYFTGVVVGPNISADRLVFRLQRGGVISGTVTDEFNDPVREARIMLFRRGLANGRFDTHFVQEGQTDDQGSYKFAPLLPGTYFVAVSARPWYAPFGGELTSPAAAASREVLDNMKRLNVAFPLTFYSGATDAGDATPIVLRNGERAPADMVLHSVPSVTLQIGNGALGSARFPFVRLSQQSFGDFDIPVLANQQGYGNGRMVISGLAPGEYRLHANIPGDAGGERIQDLDLTSDMTIDPDTLTAATGSVVKGIAQMIGGAPLPPSLVVMFRNRSTGRLQGGPVGDKGVFELDNVQPGTYEVSLANVSETFLLQTAASNAKVSGRSVTIAASASPELALVLGKGLGEIRGIALRDGRGLGGAMVLLVPVNAESSYELFRRDQSDSDGTFLLRGVVPGICKVLAIEDGWDLEWSKPEVLKPYLAKASQIDVEPNGKYDVKVQVQQK